MGENNTSQKVSITAASNGFLQRETERKWREKEERRKLALALFLRSSFCAQDWSETAHVCSRCDLNTVRLLSTYILALLPIDNIKNCAST
jgi:hypothetical protein